MTEKVNKQDSQALPKETAQPKKDAVKEKQTTPVPKAKPQYGPNTYVTVKSGFNGTLVYVSKRTGETFVWDGIGTEQDMEAIELKNAKSASKVFFENNWFMFDDQDFVDWLGVSAFYKNALDEDGVLELSKGTVKNIEEAINKLNSGQKEYVFGVVQRLFDNGKIDSVTKINAFERAFGKPIRQTKDE